MKSDLPISYSDYERICSVVISALNDLQHALAMDCMYVALVSKEILNVHHGINATIASGQARIYVGADEAGIDEILSFGEVDRNNRNPKKYHAWIQIASWLVDFSAPLYREAFQATGGIIQVPRKMMAIAIDDSGRFVKHNLLTEFVVDEDGRQELISSYEANLQFKYSRQECLDWYQRAPDKLSRSHRCKDPFGRSETIDLLDLKLEGIW